MLRYTFDLEEEAAAIERAVESALRDGYRTGDIFEEGCIKCSTTRMGDEIVKRM